MKKRISLFLALALTLLLAGCGCDHVWMAADCVSPQTCTECGETEGEPNGHSMVEASCEAPKHCENCDLTEGEALGHTWLDATTEDPKTCETCAATEGERIITDPRFTTASTIDLQGKWTLEIPFDGEMMGISGFPSDVFMYVTLTFGNAGEMGVENAVSDNFADVLVQYTVDMMYTEFAAQGMDAATVDEMFESTYGMPVAEYVEQSMSGTNMDAVLTSILEAANIGGVYYVEDGQLYTGDSWDDELVPEGFTLEGDTLTLESFTAVFGDVGAFQRVVE